MHVLYGDLMLSGRSGEKFRFQTCSFETRFRAVPAVYFVTRRFSDNATFRRSRHEVIFVGETASMAAPLGTPTQLEAFAKHGANCVCVHPSGDEALRREMVEDMILGHNPLLRG
ncbi:MAG: hypothetical protein WCJ69_12790 [Betaproteobacteria bacterium]|jgi:hypothetical protein